MSHFIVTGAKGGNTQGAEAPNRLEINDLVKIQDQFSLYIQALDAMYCEQQANDISFFGIGGIHGLPYRQWGRPAGSIPLVGLGGYCHHLSTLFPTWHRPYVALFEQVLQQHAIVIAEKYTVDEERWKTAAANLRAPYWDWAANSVPPPQVISLATVDIIKPVGKLGSVANPLLKYEFHPIDKSFPPPFSGWPTTLRRPTNTKPEATSDIPVVKGLLKAAQAGLTSSTFNLLTRVHTWSVFSHNTGEVGRNKGNSLETIHDNIHVMIGGIGHMGDAAVAGFDPIFFLHHANVDRILSLWSALHPTAWVSEGLTTKSTFTVLAEPLVDTNTSLTPFWDSESGYWTSSGATITSKLGYTYPEFNGLNMGNPPAVQDAILKIVNKMYGDAQAAGTSESKVSEDAVTPSAGGDASVSIRSVDPASTSSPSSYYEWTARIRVKKYGLGGSFSTLIFLGEVPDDPQRWHSSPSFVDAHHAFVNSAADQCENCRSQTDLVIEGFVSLGGAIAQRSGLNSFEPAVVEPYLKRELSWRVQKVDSTEVDLSDVPSLEVVVFSTPLTLEPGAMFPTPGEYSYHHYITAGHPGGSQPE